MGKWGKLRKVKSEVLEYGWSSIWDVYKLCEKL